MPSPAHLTFSWMSRGVGDGRLAPALERVEGENTRLRHYLARLQRKTLCYSKSVDMLKHSIRLLLFYLKFKTVPADCLTHLCQSLSR